MVIGGLTGVHKDMTQYSSTEILSPSASSWQYAASLPSPRYGLRAGNIHNVVYIFGKTKWPTAPLVILTCSGGYYPETDSILSYNVAADKWQEQGGMTVNRRWHQILYMDNVLCPKWTKIFSQDTIGGLFKVERSIGSHPNVILNFSLMKRLWVRILTIQKPPYSPDWTSWSSSEERGESFTSRSSILNWVAVTSGYKLLTLLKPTLLRDLSPSSLITRLMVRKNLGEDSDFVQGKIMP